MTILSSVERRRSDVIANLAGEQKGANGQFMTPAVIARAMAEMFSPFSSNPIRLLDPGAGSGALLSAFLDRLEGKDSPPSHIEVVAYETDDYLLRELAKTAKLAMRRFDKLGWELDFRIHDEDFIYGAVSGLQPDMFSPNKDLGKFTHAILNPPYRKIRSSSFHRRALRKVGIEVSNLYAAFVALALELLEDGGELVAITPRSFCNGPYFYPFRRHLISRGSFHTIHVFHSRESAFKDDKVLQENIIFRLDKGIANSMVRISSSTGRQFADNAERNVPLERIVKPLDSGLIIHIPANDFDEQVVDRISEFTSRLADLNLTVSTGPVVDFRLRSSIDEQWKPGAAALIYPAHFDDNVVCWPKEAIKKPNAIRIDESSSKWLMPNGNYVLIRRFSSKEEKRRIYPALFESLPSSHEWIGFENHVNVIHLGGEGLSLRLAKGLTVYLASSIVDLYFRQFSGHTQVNATDLRSLPIPDRETLMKLTEFYEDGLVNQLKVDAYLEKLFVSRFDVRTPNPVIEIAH